MSLMVLYLPFLVQIVFMLGFPLALGFFIWKRLGIRWGLFGVGAITFIVSQVVHLPLNSGLTAAFKVGWLPKLPEAIHLPFNAVVLGLTAGLCEELTRYLVYRFWIRKARTWREALMFGAGHGGVESIILGLLVALTFVNMLALRGMDLSALGLPADQLEALREQVTTYWALPWYVPLLAGAERFFAICLHVAMAVVVLQVFIRGKLRYLFAAVAYHALTDATAIYAAGLGWSPQALEGLVALFAVISLVIIWWYRPRRNEAETAAPASSSTTC